MILHDMLMIFGKKKIDNFDPYNVFLAIVTNIPQRLKTGFVPIRFSMSFYLNVIVYFTFISVLVILVIQLCNFNTSASVSSKFMQSVGASLY